MNKRTRLALISVILVVTIGFVAVGMLNLFVDPYLSVDQVAENHESYMGRTIQVKGKLQPGSLSITSDNVTLVIAGENHTLVVLLLGDVPDMTDGQDIVAIGTLVSATLIRATQILTQCPSKYETTTSG
jgi:cytochrome c-type biogenesis protein CcmE